MGEHDVVHRVATERARRPERLAERVDDRPPELARAARAPAARPAAPPVYGHGISRHRSLDQRVEIERRHVDLSCHQLREKQVAERGKPFAPASAGRVEIAARSGSIGSRMRIEHTLSGTRIRHVA